jgi:nicotinamide riboside kinase
MAQLGREYQAEQKGYQYLLCDRGSLDIVVFSRLFGHPLQPEWLDHLHSYEGVFVCQPDFPLQVTPLQAQVSQRDWQVFREEWQALLYEVLAELNIESVILQGDPETRLRKFLGDLSLRHQQGIEGVVTSPELKEV